jgi:hypothetical protein
MAQRGTWTPILEPGEAVRTLQVTREVAARLCDALEVERAAATAREQTGFPKSVRWQPHSLAQGNAGLAVLFGTVDRCLPGEGWDAIGHAHLQRAIRSAEQQAQLPSGMASGLAGLAFAAWSLSRDGARYTRLRRALDTTLIGRVMSDVTRLTPVNHGASVSTFDLITGLAGIGRFLLHGETRAHRAALEAVLRWLVALAGEQDGVPHWHTPVQHLADDATRNRHPYGQLNCGLAHGIPGPLAVLSLATSAGVCVEGQLPAMRRVADWLTDHCIRNPRGPCWPAAVPLGPQAVPARRPGNGPDHRPAGDARPSRTAWCYGNPGVARALWLCGHALDEAAYRDLAVAAMEAVYRTPLPERHIDAPTFCHGVAGLQQITLRFAHDSGLPVFIDAARALHRQLLDAYEPASAFGYRNTEPGGRQIDQPGLLDGAPGVAMALLAASTPVEPVWDRVFLLS